MPDEHFYSLIVKGEEDVAREEVNARALDIWMVYPAGDETVIRVLSRSDLTNLLNEWMGEDVGDPPFPDGALLHWRPLEHL